MMIVSKCNFKVIDISANEGYDLLWGNEAGRHSTINFNPTSPIKHTLKAGEKKKEKEEKRKSHGPSLQALRYRWIIALGL